MSTSVTAQLYMPLQRWQTRVLRLLPAQHADEPLRADLLQAGLADGSYLALSMDEPLIQFEAISYTWGEPGSIQHEIICNGLSIPILPSLNAALRRFRCWDKPRYLWADALCINQLDNVEKGFQVANMFGIFYKAKRVLAWLGEEGSHLGQALECLRTSSAQAAEPSVRVPVMEKKLETLDQTMAPEQQSALEALCHLPWCRRVWIRQEVFAARELTLFCGSQEIDLEEFQSIASSLLQRRGFGYLPVHSDEEDSMEKDICQAVINLRVASESELSSLREDARRYQSSAYHDETLYHDGIHYIEMFRYTHKGTHSLERTLVHSDILKASNPRDYVYALLNLTACPVFAKEEQVNSEEDNVDRSFGIVIDYSRSLERILQDVTIFIMNVDHSIAVLETYEPGAHGSSISANLPSWTIDWRTQRRRLDSDEMPPYEKLPPSPDSYQDYRSRSWQRQFSNAAGTIQLGGTVLAIVWSFHVERTPERSPVHTESSDAFLVHSEAYSHIRLRKSTMQPNRVGLDWTNLRLFTIYEIENTMRGRGQLHDWKSELKKLRRMKSHDVLVHIDGMQGRFACLRPTSGDMFLFVCIVDAEVCMELLLGSDPTRDLRGTMSEFSHSRKRENFQDFLLTADAPHQEFTLC